MNKLGEAKKVIFKDKRWSLTGMTALVTGGTKGIGFVIIFFLSFVSRTQLMGFSFFSVFHLIVKQYYLCESIRIQNTLVIKLCKIKSGYVGVLCKSLDSNVFCFYFATDEYLLMLNK